MRRSFTFSLSLVALMALIACASGCIRGERPLPPASIWPEAIASAEMPDKPVRKGQGVRAGSIAISDEIARLCTIRTQVGAAPRFAFDSDDIGEPERHVLGLVARCFTTGPLRGRAIKLTGHADPRGEEEYNMTLAALRATNVKGYLSERGVDRRKIADTSRGELDATGDEEGSWAYDRRVDIDLVR
ncbi:OmpA family protein [Pendulispora albinea]|uniref:OmpA family protein n=1 Tax=Pendulispora albinea TaxID=2741071 RepID=A0ABZ2LKK9_9BACT